MRCRLPIVLVSVAAAVLLLSGCQQKVTVEAGERVVCTYGEVVTDTVKTIEVPADQADRYGVVERTVTCERHARLADLYAAAQTAIRSGDLKTAREKLAAVVAGDPLFLKAAAQLKDIEAGKKPQPDSGGSTGGGSSGDQKPVGPVANLLRFVPDVLIGYKAQPVVADVYTLTREYVPSGGGDVESLVIVVEQYKDAASAKQAIASIKGDYPVSPSSPAANGRTLYFGTDGTRFGLVSWNENGVVVAVEASSKSRRPAGLKGALVSIAGEIVK
jgi:hypothetical protein